MKKAFLFYSFKFNLYRDGQWTNPTSFEKTINVWLRMKVANTESFNFYNLIDDFNKYTFYNDDFFILRDVIT